MPETAENLIAKYDGLSVLNNFHELLLENCEKTDSFTCVVRSTLAEQIQTLENKNRELLILTYLLKVVENKIIVS